MTGAVALTVVLVIAVVGLSLAMQSQQGLPGQRSPRPQRPSGPRIAKPSTSRRTRERKAQPPAEDLPASASAADSAEDILRGPDLARSGEEADAKVVSVVDERTIGPVTRSRLTLEIEPGDGSPYEVTTRVAFPTPESRAKVKVGGTIKVRYDKDDRTRVVVDIPTSE